MISTTGPSADRTRPAPRHASSAGFTLLELVLVMVIICTVLAAASPSLRGFFASRKTADAAARIVALAEYGRARAVAEGRMFRLNLDPSEGTYWLDARCEGLFERLATEFGRTFRLPDGTRASWLEPPDAAERRWILIFPDGRAEAARILIEGRQDESVEVVCPSPAERFRVAERSEEESDR